MQTQRPLHILSITLFIFGLIISIAVVPATSAHEITAPKSQAHIAGTPWCGNINYNQEFHQKYWVYFGGYQYTHIFTLQFNKRVCWNGSEAWIDGSPSHRTYMTSNSMARAFSAGFCSNSVVTPRSSSGTRSTCQFTLSMNTDTTYSEATIVPQGADNASGDFVIRKGSSLNRYHSVLVSPQGCVTISGVGKNGAAYCFNSPYSP